MDLGLCRLDIVIVYRSFIDYRVYVLYKFLFLSQIRNIVLKIENYQYMEVDVAFKLQPICGTQNTNGPHE